MGDDLIQKFGYTEMYEWENIPANNLKTGRFVVFSEKTPEKIVLSSKENQIVVGVSTVNAVVESDNPSEWKYKNLCNEYGDLYLRKEKLAVGEKIYDQLNEMNYIRTRPWEHFIPITNKYFDESKKYLKRTNRAEWTRVTILGKAIVFDDGKCEPGTWCTPYTGKLKENYGMAVPATDKSKNKYYVLDRLSKTTILILFK